LEAELDALHMAANDSDLMSRTEKDRLKAETSACENSITKTLAQQEQCLLLWAAHTSIAYDSLRLFATGISLAGAGTREASLRLSIKGLPIFKHLPRAAGEPSFIRHFMEDKATRAEARKNAALAAMERERARRFMTDEEKAAAKAERVRLQALQFQQEETELFSKANAARLKALDDPSTHLDELSRITRMWKKLADTRAKRHGKTGTYPSTTHSLTPIHSLALPCLALPCPLAPLILSLFFVAYSHIARLCLSLRLFHSSF
jgi:hypothetical protein